MVNGNGQARAVPAGIRALAGQRADLLVALADCGSPAQEAARDRLEAALTEQALGGVRRTVARVAQAVTPVECSDRAGR